MSETDNAALAVAQVFQVRDFEWLDRLVELLRHADMESFRTKFLAGHKAEVGGILFRTSRRARQVSLRFSRRVRLIPGLRLNAKPERP